ncbi:cyclin-dependent protein kinase inhibitor SMR3 [Pyrus ussuriensis x Pyrus communis]|uniref:Cyclin-dependent protein kinase inhibitor SMR3 n=1 Tax=Pyrus ussuriensis x Pyrus communis TaxID=2448454 RepID=A0A5N5I709_9ROSA|nr:cyclin-dependent protein kinase inhibitor SMR3 [Pyrus ussuriensis x Pyrus communis]
MDLTSVKPIKTKSEEKSEEATSTTPTAKEARLMRSENVRCPPAPKKSRPSKAAYNGIGFPPVVDLEKTFNNC